jgi:MFS transporter, PAT family, beta-lactamase induction signal transducer AmpG
MNKPLLRNPIFWVVSLYFAQGLPYGIVQLMGPVYFTAMGASPALIGLTSLIGLPWNLKLLWSPLVDLLGKRRTWVATMLALLVGATALLALIASFDLGTIELAHLGQIPVGLLAVGAVLILIAFLSATADIAEDAFYMDALSEREQALHLGTRIAAYRVAMVTASGLLVYLAGRFGWTLGFGLAALFMGAVAAICVMTLPNPQQPPREHKEPGEFAREYGRAFVSYVKREKPIVVLSFILTYKLGEMMLGRMSTPFFMNECGVTTSQMGLVSGIFGTGASIFGAIAGSILIAKKGMWKSLVAITLAMNGTNLLYVLLALVEAPTLVHICAVHGVEHFSGGLGSAAFAFFLIRTCKADFRAAHYALATGLMSLVGTLVGSVSGFFVQSVGYFSFFILCIVLAVPGTALLFFLPRKLAGREQHIASNSVSS